MVKNQHHRKTVAKNMFLEADFEKMHKKEHT